MKCEFCGGQTFIGHQVCHLDVLVDDEGAFVDNMPGGAEAAIYYSNTPFGPFRCCGCGAEYDELKDGQEAISGPIEGWSFSGDETEDARTMGVVLVRLVRERANEKQVWVDDLYVLLEKEEFSENSTTPESLKEYVMSILRSRIQHWLTTAEGWKSNCCSSHDYNWGDYINDIPSKETMCFSAKKEVNGYDVLDTVDIGVNQDELLAPFAQPAQLLLSYKDGRTECRFAVVDFQDGEVSCSHAFDPYEIENAHVLPDGGEDKLPCDPEKGFLRLLEM